MARHEFVLCRRDLADFGAAPKFCAKPISVPNALNWCASCRSHLPLWPANDAPLMTLTSPIDYTKVVLDEFDPATPAQIQHLTQEVI